MLVLRLHFCLVYELQVKFGVFTDVVVHFANMVVKVTLGRKSSFTTYNLAKVRFLASMQPHVSLEISFFEKRLSTIFERAYEIAETFMLLEVYLKTLNSAIGLSAIWIGACILFILKMSG